MRLNDVRATMNWDRIHAMSCAGSTITSKSDIAVNAIVGVTVLPSHA